MKQKNQAPLVLRIVRWIYPKAERIAPFAAHWYFARLFFTPLKFRTPEKERKSETFADKFTLTVSGKKVQCYSWGTGDVYILFVHGWAGRATQFRRFVKPVIAAGYRMVAFDGPAHGNSEGGRTSILEFEEALKKIYDLRGIPEGIIAHSFGGGAVLFAAMNGLPVDKLINIGTPTIGDEIINTYLRTIHGSSSTGVFFKDYMIRKYGKPFDAFTSLHFVKHLPRPVNLLLVHDEDDKEVIIRHAEELVRAYPQAGFVRTQGLGHTRILKDDGVIRTCVTFIREGSSRLL